ncbi:MAG TPA: septal ring lytic transglycosylase RlpA family protein, partial [Mariprofundaceae bacterium]|nr:septal ring lytic transglycosylase RlpA family protein [Mariprofundaceae bacterium]
MRLALAAITAMGLAACSTTSGYRHYPASLPSGAGGHTKTGTPYSVNGRTYYPLASAYGYDATGVASWYGRDFHGKRTADGEWYDMHAMSAAHPTLPLPTLVRVTNLDNGRQVVVRVNDRGPFVRNRLIDLSYAAAEELGFANKGTTHVRVQALAGL